MSTKARITVANGVQPPRLKTAQLGSVANPVDAVSRLAGRLHRLQVTDSHRQHSSHSSLAGNSRVWQRNLLTATGEGGQCKDLNIGTLANLLSEKQIKNVVVMVGAGISTPSGIPDFRTPGTGLYDNLRQYNIPYPEAVFDIEYFALRPKAFFTLAKELLPNGGKYRPNYVHYFVRILHEKGLLLRVYTQNIDGLERLAGIPPSKLVEAHGTFATASCTKCGLRHKGEEVKADIAADRMPRCASARCRGMVKPDIVFFGENLPSRFYLHTADFPLADLVIVMGTSLEVEPFASILQCAKRETPRLLINRELVGPFKLKSKQRDVTMIGDLVDNVQSFSKLIGWDGDVSNAMSEVESKARDELATASANETEHVVTANEAARAPSMSAVDTKPVKPRQLHILAAPAVTTGEGGLAESSSRRPSTSGNGFVSARKFWMDSTSSFKLPLLGASAGLQGSTGMGLATSKESSSTSSSLSQSGDTSQASSDTSQGSSGSSA